MIASGSAASIGLARKIAKRSVVYVMANGFMAVLGSVAYSCVAVGLRQDDALLRLCLFAAGFSFVASSICGYFYFIKKVFGKQRIHQNIDSSDNAVGEALRGLVVDHALIDSLSFMVVCRLMGFDSSLYHPLTLSMYFSEFMAFIPKSIMAELIFDFLHYWTHRLCHRNKFLYRYVHAAHHSQTHPGILSTFVMHPLDYVATNCIPLWLTLLVGPTLSPLQLQLLLAYKMFVEVGGHTGLQGYFSCPQFPCLAWYSDYMILYSDDHSWHHVIPNKNFAKRYAIWDHVFATYETPNFQRARKGSPQGPSFSWLNENSNKPQFRPR